jgi:hypothetical protein
MRMMLRSGLMMRMPAQESNESMETRPSSAAPLHRTSEQTRLEPNATNTKAPPTGHLPAAT